MNDILHREIQKQLCSICDYYRDGMCLRMEIEVDAFDGCSDCEETEKE